MSVKNCFLSQVKRLCQILIKSNHQVPSSLRKTQLVHLCRSCSTLLREQNHTVYQVQTRLKSSITRFRSENMAESKDGERQTEQLPSELFHTSVGQQEGWLVVGPYKVFAW
ncbi:hypothetical protein EGW08_013019, partial [Elysia chlorotica]